MKKILFIFLFLTSILIGCYFYISRLFSPVSSDKTSVDFLITKGSSVSQIAINLEKNKLIKSSILFKFYVQITNSTNKIQAGEFQLSPNLSLSQIVNELKKGPKEIWVTIPEGLRREEVALKFAKSLNKDDKFIKEFLDVSKDKEGYLFPDTYLFPKSATAIQIVDKMTSTFSKKIKDITIEQIIIASMLERETFSDSEKPIVAGIIYKRLKNKWPLQIDATLQYAIATAKCQFANEKCNYWEQVTVNDKNITSLYNTYKNIGLPPTAIASAGLSSLKAAVNPEESEYWYYIHDDKGQIHFAKTLEEHNENISKYLK